MRCEAITCSAPLGLSSGKGRGPGDKPVETTTDTHASPQTFAEEPEGGTYGSD